MTEAPLLETKHQHRAYKTLQAAVHRQSTKNQRESPSTREKQGTTGKQEVLSRTGTPKKETLLVKCNARRSNTRNCKQTKTSLCYSKRHSTKNRRASLSISSKHNKSLCEEKLCKSECCISKPSEREKHCSKTNCKASTTLDKTVRTRQCTRSKELLGRQHTERRRGKNLDWTLE